MEKRKMNTRYMATLAMFCGVLLVMGVTGIGFIPLPVIKATTMHIPVILGAVLLGPGAGAVLGGVFGLCSIWGKYHQSRTAGICVFALYDHGGSAGGAEKPVDRTGVPDSVRRDCGMAVEAV